MKATKIPLRTGVEGGTPLDDAELVPDSTAFELESSETSGFESFKTPGFEALQTLGFESFETSSERVTKINGKLEKKSCQTSAHILESKLRIKLPL